MEADTFPRIYEPDEDPPVEKPILKCTECDGSTAADQTCDTCGGDGVAEDAIMGSGIDDFLVYLASRHADDWAGDVNTAMGHYSRILPPLILEGMMLFDLDADEMDTLHNARGAIVHTDAYGNKEVTIFDDDSTFGEAWAVIMARDLEYAEARDEDEGDADDDNPF
jgi:hypothetical protein